MFAAGLLDPAGGLTCVVGRIQQPVDQITAQMLRDPGLGMQHLAQMTILLHGSAAALFQQVVGVLPPQMPGKLDADRLRQDKTPGLLQVAQHARGSRPGVLSWRSRSASSLPGIWGGRTPTTCWNSAAAEPWSRIVIWARCCMPSPGSRSI